MARNRNLAAAVAAARPARARAGSGVGQARVAAPSIAVGQRQPVGGRWNPRGESPHTQFAKGLSAAPAAGPVASAGPPSLGTPWDSRAESEWGAGEQKYNDQIAGLTGDWNSRAEWYGLGESNNPWSQASLLAHRHEVDNRSVLNSAGLNLYSGSTVNHHATADRNFSISREGLVAAYNAELERKNRAEEEARHVWESEQGGIKQGALERLEETTPPPAPEAAAAAAAPGSGPGASSGQGKNRVGIGSNRPAPSGKRKR